tara:strand:+ start:974 stop:1564 length:591 start_codon:yes stop_codon:yes gene_type:complete
MNAIPNSLKNLIEQFSKLPGIGKKTAERLSIYMLKVGKEEANNFSESINNLKTNIQTCNVCHSFTDDICYICNDSSRDEKIICVVEDPVDIFLIEKSGFKGMYHVLNGLISPLDGIKPENLNIDSLLKRLNEVEEIVLGIEASSEGDVTNLYLSEALKNLNIRVTRFSRGMPIGSSLEFVDELTLTHSINDRVEVK